MEVWECVTRGTQAESRKVLLVKAASAMKAVLAKKTTLFQNPLTQPLLQPPELPATTGVQTPRLPGVPQPFHMSWTGTEPPAAYATHRDADKHSYWLWSALWTPPAAAAIYFPLKHRASVNSSLILLGYLIAFFAVVCIIQAAWETVTHAKDARQRPQRSAWTLHVGPQHIVTVGGNGRREFTWDQIQGITIEEIQGSLPYRYTGIHVQFTPGASQPPRVPPAGWPHPESNTITHRKGGKVPVCVLGPMTGQQRIELTEAIAIYGDGQCGPPTA